jgi:hypothetical protein
MKHSFFAVAPARAFACALALAVVLAAVLALAGCSSSRIVVGEEPCSVRDWQATDFFTQDILPGMESNLRKQRIYIVVGDAESAGDDAAGKWSLAVDSVLIPLRLRAEEDGSWQWSGGRNFYQSVREGVMTTDEMHPDGSGLDLMDAAYLIHLKEGQCTARPLPTVRHIGTVAMP